MTSIRVKNDRSAIASTMSGMIIGANSSASTLGEVRRCSIPIASMVPSTVAIAVDDAATMSELRVAAMILGLAASFPYQSKENPVQAVGMPARLNDSTDQDRDRQIEKGEGEPEMERQQPTHGADPIAPTRMPLPH